MLPVLPVGALTAGELRNGQSLRPARKWLARPIPRHLPGPHGLRGLERGRIPAGTVKRREVGGDFGVRKREFSGKGTQTA